MTPPAAGAASSSSATTESTAKIKSAETVQKRRTKNFRLREELSLARGSAAINVPPLSPNSFDTWDAFAAAWTEHMRATKTLYRRRSSSTVAAWNAKYGDKKPPVPADQFQYATMAYWCTHGCIQPSRGTGVRAHLRNRFTGCAARLIADVVREEDAAGRARWFVRVRHQVTQHNHRVNDEISLCYANNSSVPDDLLLGDAAADAHREADREARRRRAAVAGDLQPLLKELRRAPPEVVLKRLEDVSGMVSHLLKKWQRDQAIEEQLPSNAPALPGHFVGGSTDSGAVPATEPTEQRTTATSNYGDGPGAVVPLPYRTRVADEVESRGSGTGASASSHSPDSPPPNAASS
ncbi:hypothetical protein PybrP1_001541 [[Pythium] brassicae (nom. inval.)]|nr:hypothetical protein PybrP1_001541 [[Pythium] brassicae (nom. inval.)]